MMNNDHVSDDIQIRQSFLKDWLIIGGTLKRSQDTNHGC